MKRISLITLLSAAVLLMSCSKQSESSESSSNDYITEISANVPVFVIDDGTKTTLSLTSSGVSFAWDVNDQLGFIPDAVSIGIPDQHMFYVEEISEDKTSAKFKANGWGLLSNKKYYSYYPFEKGAAGNAIDAIYSNQEQKSNNNLSHLGSHDYLHSFLDVSSAAEENKAIGSSSVQFSITYRHLGCLARFILNIPAENSGVRFTEMTLSSADAIFVNSLTFNPLAETVDLSAATKEMSKSLSVKLNGTTGFASESNTLTVYAMMSPYDMSGKTITVTLNGKDNSATEYTFKGSFTGKNQTLNTSDGSKGKGYSYSANMVDAAIPDLSNPESANCYIVSEPGKEYKFKTVKGNSSESVGTVKSVKVLWETKNTTTKPNVGDLIEEVSYENDYIIFKTKSAASLVKGNALIAAYSGDNGSGDILWSWHIWLTNKPGDDTYTDFTLMDRNLGALSKGRSDSPAHTISSGINSDDAFANGLLYQWGRKDPFMGAGTDYESGTYTNVSMPSQPVITSIGNVPTSQGALASVATSIKNPTVFYKGSEPSGSSKGVRHWSSGKEINLWSGDASLKTKYDPCPPGYHIPASFNGLSYTDGPHESYTGEMINGYYWPKAGMRGLSTEWEDKYEKIIGLGKLTGVGQTGGYWSAQASMGAAGNYIGLGKILNMMGANSLGTNNDSYIISGQSVRCQKNQ